MTSQREQHVRSTASDARPAPVKFNDRAKLGLHDDVDWEAHYVASDTPWDQGQITPALAMLLAERTPDGSPVIPRGGLALVPGCGRGYDVLALAAAGDASRHAIGIDLSPTAVAAAEAGRKAWVPGSADVPKRASFKVADFFAFTAADLGLPVSASPGGAGPPQFDVVFDYTFLCALPPATYRGAWARRMAELVRPGGVLIALMFPLPKSVDLAAYTASPTRAPAAAPTNGGAKGVGTTAANDDDGGKAGVKFDDALSESALLRVLERGAADPAELAALRGPPYPVHPEHTYAALLEHGSESGDGTDAFERVRVAPCASIPARQGRELISIWRRRA